MTTTDELAEDRGSFVVIQRGQRISRSPAVTISRGQFRFNKQATALLAPQGRFVTIWWDRDERKVAFSMDKTQQKTSYRLTVNPKASQSAFTAVAFLRHIGWNGGGSFIELREADGRLEGHWPDTAPTSGFAATTEGEKGEVDANEEA